MGGGEKKQREGAKVRKWQKGGRARWKVEGERE